MSRLHRIDTGSSAKTSAVIFVHGLGGRPYSTWGGADPELGVTPGGPLFWPAWIAAECPQIAVYALQYEAEPTEYQGDSLTLKDRGREILQSLHREADLASLPLAFVCHSLGGLVVKQVIYRARNDDRPADADLLDRIRQIVFMATPHRGAQLPVIAQKTRWVSRPTPVMRDLHEASLTLADLQETFEGFCRPGGRAVATRVFYELKPMALATLFGVPLRKHIVVTQASARIGWVHDDHAEIAVEADHGEITKPTARGPQCGIYKTIYPPILELLKKLPEQPTNRVQKVVTGGWKTGERFFWDQSRHSNGLPRTPNTFVAREGEFGLLQAAWDGRRPRVQSLIASGGTGKTALTREFIERMQQRPEDQQPEAIIAWSFDSQGTSEQRQGSSDAFLSGVLQWLGETDLPTDAAEKATRLARLLARHRILLVLDGIEPLQAAGDSVDRHGRLRDKGLPALLDELRLSNAGLCLITSRLPLADYRDTPPEQVGQERLKSLTVSEAVELLRSFNLDYPQVELEALARDYGAQVPVTDADGHVDTEVRCHAKAVALAGAFIRNRFPDLRHRPVKAEIAAAFSLPDEVLQGAALDPDHEDYQTFRMLRRFEKLYVDEARRQRQSPDSGVSKAGRQLALLRILGLFDRPAEWAAVMAVLAPPAIIGLTDRLGTVSGGEWEEALRLLRDDGLVNRGADTAVRLTAASVIDAHPLVREYFGRRVAATIPEAFRTAHGRIYDFLRFKGLPPPFDTPVPYAVLALCVSRPEDVDFYKRELALGSVPSGTEEVCPPSLHSASPSDLKLAADLIGTEAFEGAKRCFLPDGVEAESRMQPLFMAVGHGCAAGRYAEAFAEVTVPRCDRGEVHYASKFLCLYGAELAAEAHFFDKPYVRPIGRSAARPGGLSLGDQAKVLNRAGFRLQALGRLEDAVAPMRAQLEMSIEQCHWEYACIGSVNVATLLFTLGRLDDERDADGRTLPGARGMSEVVRSTAEGYSAAAEAMGNEEQISDARLRQIFATCIGAELEYRQGRMATAISLFRVAEARQRALKPSRPLLYHVLSHQWIDLRLAQGRAAEAQARAEAALDGYSRPLHIALHKLALARAAHLAARKTIQPSFHLTEAQQLNINGRFEQAELAMKAANSSDEFPRLYLARAAFHRERGASDLAWTDLTRAIDIARRGNMRLFLIPAEIETARQRLAPHTAGTAAFDAAAAVRALDRAARLIAETGLAGYAPDLTLARAELALATSDLTEVSPLLAAAIDAMVAQDLWGHRPTLDRLAVTYGTIPATAVLAADLSQRLAALATTEALYNAYEDGQFSDTRKPSTHKRGDLLWSKDLDPHLASEAARWQPSN